MKKVEKNDERNECEFITQIKMFVLGIFVFLLTILCRNFDSKINIIWIRTLVLIIEAVAMVFANYAVVMGPIVGFVQGHFEFWIEMFYIRKYMKERYIFLFRRIIRILRPLVSTCLYMKYVVTWKKYRSEKCFQLVLEIIFSLAMGITLYLVNFHSYGEYKWNSEKVQDIVEERHDRKKLLIMIPIAILVAILVFIIFSIDVINNTYFGWIN